jgi:SAM-dependent methyltransferase
MTNYDPGYLTRYFDEYGDREWDRLTNSPEDLVRQFIHTYYLEKYLKPGLRVLEIGAGAGRFTQVLARLDCRVTVADISAGQLELNRRHAQEDGYAEAVEDWLQLDICELHTFPPATFDAIVAYGGPLSYVFEQAGQAAAECRRVLKPGGLFLLSVMSLWGTAHKALNGVLSIPAAQNRRIIATGDLTPENFPGQAHFCHMFRSGELRVLLVKTSLNVLEMSASNCLSTCWNELLSEISEDTEKWNELLHMELEACREPGCLDLGTHLLAVARK